MSVVSTLRVPVTLIAFCLGWFCTAWWVMWGAGRTCSATRQKRPRPEGGFKSEQADVRSHGSVMTVLTQFHAPRDCRHATHPCSPTPVYITIMFRMPDVCESRQRAHR